jgi:hypothetical protein
LTPIAHISAGVVGAFLLDSLIFHRPPSAETLELAVGLSLLPDLDAPLVAALKGEWPPRGRNEHHQSFTHTPLFYLAVAFLLMPLLSTRGMVFFGALVLLHLALDSWATDDGIMWLWPYTGKQYALLPVPARAADAFGWRYYRHLYFRERRHAAWAEVGLTAMGVGVTVLMFMPALGALG